LLRTKYVVQRLDTVAVALGLGLHLPTGSTEDLQGAGDTRVEPLFIVSGVLGDRVEPLLNLGVDINADSVDRSVARWAAGASAEIVGPLTGAVVFLGRHELTEQTTPIEVPFFFQVRRNDVFDVSIGARYLVADLAVVGAAVQLPLNDDGLRAAAIPTLQLEYTF
jgi:hypothetical protein